MEQRYIILVKAGLLYNKDKRL